jgi:hypothetical protein
MTLLGEVPAVAVLYTMSPVAGLAMVVISAVPVNVTLGGKNPLLVLFTSSCAEVLGVVVPMPTWAFAIVTQKRIVSTKSRESMFLFMVYNSLRNDDG